MAALLAGAPGGICAHSETNSKQGWILAIKNRDWDRLAAWMDDNVLPYHDEEFAGRAYVLAALSPFDNLVGRPGQHGGVDRIGHDYVDKRRLQLLRALLERRIDPSFGNAFAPEGNLIGSISRWCWYPDIYEQYEAEFHQMFELMASNRSAQLRDSLWYPLLLGTFEFEAPAACRRTIKVLISLGADVNAVFSPGYTPISMAVQGRSVRVLCLLLRAGADPRTTLPWGPSVLSFAIETGRSGMTKLLQLYSRGIDVLDPK